MGSHNPVSVPAKVRISAPNSHVDAGFFLCHINTVRKNGAERILGSRPSVLGGNLCNAEKQVEQNHFA